MPARRPAPAVVPLEIDQYLLRERISMSGMGIVWRADQRRLAGATTVKLVEPDLSSLPDVLARMCDPTHPRAAATIELGGGAPPLVVMEHVEGTSLAHRLRAGEAFSTARAVGLVTQLLRALAEAHAAGMVHADIRPEHVFVATRLDGSDVVTLVDVGDPDDEGMVGAPAYLAPEIITGGHPTVASDLYAVAVILYELLTGAPPFGGATLVEAMTRQLRDPVPPPSLRRRIPGALERAILCALARSPSERFADAASFAAALEAVAPPDEVERLRVEVAHATERGAGDDLVARSLDLAAELSRRARHVEALSTLDAAAERIMWDERLGRTEIERLLERLGGARARIAARA